ncbi:hypothetical protein OOZ15_02370 [Galbibacter sp. EGI 63066]|uniref:hypothetical protein n=1 Tax=Galbibacter sp. EGI 63066 TaxID=2993559 RepID=UPI0022490951|nr:hypothetical protein [Galbibacter sp. EGI 63066]MCX2678774.1 hypothetical protein [Galbibacter sp. EGI 63066]
MKLSFVNSDELLGMASEMELYKKLIAQLNKDLKLANLDEEFSPDVSAGKLKRDLHEVIFLLINEKFSDYLNLLYIVDVSEAQVKTLDGTDVVKLAEEVAFLILKREWQKVWFRAKH